jgi:hypothetical protein
MANQIAKYFASQGPGKGVPGTADHIKKLPAGLVCINSTKSASYPQAGWVRHFFITAETASIKRNPVIECQACSLNRRHEHSLGLGGKTANLKKARQAGQNNARRKR